uniref:Uncharacterized protein n=1 Tax=viral metagenome TaxID=1070528 RepID=A0A6C0JSD2_9ZZZZ
MSIPLRCFTCGKVIGNVWEPYLILLKKYTEGEALDLLNIKKYCCRRMVLSNVDQTEKLLMFVSLSKT